LTNENFIDENREKLQDITCSICLNIINQPISQCQNCEELFCENCIDKYIQTNDNCPHCRNKPFQKQILGRKFKNLLNHLKFRCPLQCGELFGFADSESHKDSCEKLKDVYQCTLCEKKMEFQEDLKIKHKTQCEQLKISCFYCKRIISISYYKNHLKTCDEWMDFCQKCNLMVCRKYQDAHTNFFCPHIQNLSLLIKKIENSQNDLKNTLK